jgi:hypothetical protein
VYARDAPAKLRAVHSFYLFQQIDNEKEAIRMIIRVARACAVAVCILTSLGCTGGTGRINLSDHQRSNLSRLPLVQAVHWQYGEGLIPIVQYNPWPPHTIYSMDPITMVKKQVLLKLVSQHGFTNIQSVEEQAFWTHGYSLISPCCLQRGIGELQDLFGNADILEFASVNVFLSDRDPYHVDLGLSVDRLLRRKINLYFSARARLIHLQDRTVLWQGRCQVEVVDTPVEMREEVEARKSILEQQLSEAAQECSTQLLQQFQDSGPT